MAKITFGTGGMLDVCRGAGARPRLGATTTARSRSSPGRSGGEITWGVEAIMLSAGTNIEWLRDDLGLIDDAPRATSVAAAVPTTDGVVFVPALLGLGTPRWDYGARGHAARR